MMIRPSASSIVIELVDFADPSSMLISAAEEPISASMVKLPGKLFSSSKLKFTTSVHINSQSVSIYRSLNFKLSSIRNLDKTSCRSVFGSNSIPAPPAEVAAPPSLRVISLSLTNRLSVLTVVVVPLTVIPG